MIDEIVSPIPVTEDEFAARALRFANTFLNAATVWERMALIDFGGFADLCAIIPARQTHNFHWIANRHAEYVAYCEQRLGDPSARAHFDRMIGRDLFMLIEQRVRGARR
jgi:hypothetical protein